jgi:hypothetical protein
MLLKVVVDNNRCTGHGRCTLSPPSSSVSTISGDRRSRPSHDPGRPRLWPSVDWTGLIGLRNVLVHAYHRIQPDLLWQAAAIDIPAVAAELGSSKG